MLKQQPDFAQELRARGFRVTPTRVRILVSLWRGGQPHTVEEIARRLKIDVVTAHRALNDFAQSGLALRGVGDGHGAHFSFPSGGHHHHLVCKDCGFGKSCSIC